MKIPILEVIGITILTIAGIIVSVWAIIYIYYIFTHPSPV